MAGPQDRVAEQGPSPDSVRPREPDRVDAELQQRMERLPPGHPSSPYNDDGSRKPPVPDPFEHDYPIPGDPGFHSDAPSSRETSGSADNVRNDESPASDRSLDQELPAEDRERLDDHDAQERDDRRLSRITAQAVERCRQTEGRDADGNYGERGLTPAMRRIETQLDHGHLADKTEEYALKNPERFKEKLAERIERYSKADPNDLATEIHDGIRYTFVFDFERYTESVNLAQNKLTNAGYDHIETKPGWQGDEYKGVNSQWLDSASGLRFEVQFHTDESWSVKQTTHKAYEKIRSTSTPIEEVETLRAYQREVSATVRIPPAALDIPAYKKEGR
jgi:hypothetical protein